jgi:hypothetical protein
VTDVTVFCAVWHQDGRRRELLKVHRENLRRQSLPVQVLYVFDGGDTLPEDLDAEIIAANKPLTNYQALNLALAAVRTPLVMNLNLDDRLAPDAVEKLVGHLRVCDAVLTCGDWRIYYSQEETDLVGQCYAATDIPFSVDCPPAVDPPPPAWQRHGRRRTYGPATLWRTTVHAKVPRYPWRFKDETLIRSVVDGAFCSILSHLGARLSRLSLVICKYHIHPSERAEYCVKESLAEILPNIMKV